MLSVLRAYSVSPRTVSCGLLSNHSFQFFIFFFILLFLMTFDDREAKEWGAGSGMF